MNAIAVGWRVVGSGGDALTPTVRSRLIQSNFNDLSADISCAWIDGILYRIPWPPFPLADARKKKISADVFFQVIFPSLASLAVEFAMPL